MPKRGMVASVLTAAGLVLLLSFKTPSQPLARSVRGNGAVVGQPASPTPDAARTPAAPSESTAPQASTSAPTPAQATNGTVTGPAVANPYGDVQVQVTFSNGTMTDIVALQMPNDRFRSAEISQQAEPLLRQEALQAQSAQIDLLSGATYTSEAYVESLQAVLDQAHG